MIKTMKRTSFILFILILNTEFLNGQILNEIFPNENIRSIQFSPQQFDLGYPIFMEENDTPLELTFDLMGDLQPALAYRLIHCNANWEKSSIQTRDYLLNPFNQFYIENYKLSFGTQKLYTHYSAIIDKSQLKLSGNYIIQVFPEDNPDKLWLQMRFVYSESQISIFGKIDKNTSYETHQRIQFDVDYDKAKFPYPRTNITTLVSQNFRWDNTQTLTPLFISNNLLRFNYVDQKGLFGGNYEFPYFDTSNILQETHTVRTLEQDEEGITHCFLYPTDSAANNYFYIKDMNGNYTIKAENTFQNNTEADYVWVHFTLLNKELPNGAYVVGRFNQWKADEGSQLAYDKELGLYHIGLLLKQGVYNYTFVTKSNDGQLQNLLGSYKETENDYYIFVYYKDEHLQTDRLIGWKRINSEDLKTAY